MNYTYEIKNSDYSPDISEMMIIEFLNDEFQESWYMRYLKKNRIDNFMVLHLRDSFERTRNWVLQNHPELLL
jgi:hypothetical protein